MTRDEYDETWAVIKMLLEQLGKPVPKALAPKLEADVKAWILKYTKQRIAPTATASEAETGL